MNKKIFEGIDTIPASRIVDDGENWIMRDVVLLSEYSKNEERGKCRRYPKETMLKALPLFESLQVNANHPPAASSGGVDSSARDVLLTLGHVVAPKLITVQEGKKSINKITGDVVLVKGLASDHIVKLARLNPKLAGMSITGDGDFTFNESFAEITNLTPCTVDIVHRPATTKGFFESIREIGAIEQWRMMSAADALRYLTETTPVVEGEAVEKTELAEGTNPFAKKKPDRAPDDTASTAKGPPDAAPTGKEPAPAGKPAVPAGKTPPPDGAAPADPKAAVPGKDGPPAPNKPGAETPPGKDPNAPEGEGKPKFGPDGKPLADGKDGAAPSMDGKPAAGGSVDAYTSEANQATVKAGLEKTSDSHLAAAFAHMKAAGLCYEAGNLGRAIEHYDKSQEHEAMADRLRDQEKPAMGSTMPELGDKKTNSVSGVSGMEGLEWVAKLYE